MDESVKRMDAMLEDVRNSLKVGLSAPNDVLSVEAQRARQQMLLIQARNSLRADAGRPAPAHRRSAGQPHRARRRARVGSRAGAAGGQPRRHRARARGPIARRSRRASLGATDRREASVANRRPTLSVGGGVNLSNPNPLIFPRAAQWNGTFDASVNLSWTFWDFGRTRGRHRRGHAPPSARPGSGSLEFDTTLDVEVRQRRLDLDSARAAVASAEDSVRAATEARRVVGDRFAAGVATPTDVLNAQVALLQAGLDRTQALATVRLAEARLDRALGR